MDNDRLVLSVASEAGVDAARVATALARELAREGVRVTNADGTAPPNAKSGVVIMAGSLVISGAVSVQIARSITQIVIASIRRGLAGRIRFEDGDRKLEVENASRDTERALVAWLTQSDAYDPSGE